jgi:maltooligosyltrehalose trehalohydrolase
VIYETHIGTFTQQGTWEAAAARLPDLAELGVTTLEIMPLAEFSGTFGWGYDGVNLFAPAHVYGEPQDVQRFVDQAHHLGLAVILDVVYNHFGPVGNFFAEFSDVVRGAPNEWGDSINYDGPGTEPVRRFMMENAAYWIREFHFDGLRFDATQNIRDTSDQHIVSEVCRAARQAAGGRTLFLVGESEPQDTRFLKDAGTYADGLDAIWNEDWHHSAFVALTGRREGYFADYLGTAPEFASMARHGPLYQGQWYQWQRHARGGAALGLTASHFVAFLENHDQVANTGLGLRLCHHVDPASWRALTALLLLGPSAPMLFQGQEFGSSQPFVYFADHDGALAPAVEQGRLEFLSQFASLATPEMRRLIPKPSSRAAYEMSRLADDQRSADNGLTRLHRDLLRLRRTDPVLSELGSDGVLVESSAPTASLLLLRYRGASADRLLVVNLADDHLSPMNDPLLAPPRDAHWSHVWSSEHPQYGGRGVIRFPEEGRWLIPSHSASLHESQSS